MTLPASVDTPAMVDRAETTPNSPVGATSMPEADPAAAAQIPSDEPASLASEIARRRLGERLRRIKPDLVLCINRQNQHVCKNRRQNRHAIT